MLKFVDGLQDLILQSGDGFPGAIPGGLVRARFGPCGSARQFQASKFADHRVAADADAGCDLAAGEAGFKMTLQQFDAIGGPGRYIRKHVSRFHILCEPPRSGNPRQDAFPLSRIASSPSLMASRMPSSIKVLATPGTLVPWVPCLT